MLKGTGIMKTKYVLISILSLSSLMVTGCSERTEDNNMGTGTSDTQYTEASDNSYNTSDDIQGDESGLGEIQTADVQAARIAVTFENDNTLIGWGLGKNKDNLGRPLDAVNAQKKYGKYSSLFIDASENDTIYLTFDEGYENGYTNEILDTLKATGVKATFFVTYDYCKTSPELVERMISEGHTVGNHSYSHPSFPKCSESEVVDEVMMLHEYVKEQFGYEMSLFRFPMGEFSEKTMSQLQDMGYTSVFWSFAYQDWNADKQPSADQAYETITSSSHCGGIYLLHAVSKANSDCLEDVIRYWQSSGFVIGDLEKLSSGL